MAENPCAICPYSVSGFCAAVLAESAHSQPHGASWRQHRVVAAGRQVVNRNDDSKHVYVLCTGWGFRFIQSNDGRRQILNFLLPGDLFSAASIFEERPHYSVKAVTAVQISEMSRNEVQSRLAADPAGLRTFAMACASEIEDLDELVTALGRLSAEERIARLLLQLTKRISARNVVRDRYFPMPLRQQHIADATGLTSVHVSRILSALRAREVLDLSNGHLRIIDPIEFARLGSAR